MIDQFVIPLLKIIIVLNATLVAVTYMVLLERKVIAWAQSRLGPMRVGPYGVLQPVADAVKLMIKEDITPTRADKWVFTAAPIISMVPALIVYAVIPFGPEVNLFGRKVSLYITHINVGLLYVVSVASVGVYGIILAGYASNSKFPLLASLRASAQLISYEVAITLTLVSVILMAGTLDLVKIVDAQYDQRVWFIFVQPIAFVLVLIGGLAETNRAPFDLPEAEQELTGGFHTEYSGMRFALFFLAEYANMIVVSSVVTTLFLGGWLPPFPNTRMLHFLYYIPSWMWFFFKSFAFLYLFMLVNLKRPPEAHHDPHRQTRLGFGLAAAVLVELGAIAAYSVARPARALVVATAARGPMPGNTEQVGWLLYTSYLIPFEIAAMLLLVAMIGAIVLAKREL